MAMSRVIGGGSSVLTTREYLNCTNNPSSTSQASYSFSKKKSLESCRIYGFPRTNLQHYDPIPARRSCFVVRNNTTPPPGLPGSPSGSMRNWILGIVLTFVLPFCTHKWGPLLVLKNKVDNVLNTAEYIMETMEEVAEKVDNVIDNITDDLPENSKLRKTMEAVDELVEGVAKTAHLANHLIDKVEEVEEKLESMITDEAAKEEASTQVGVNQKIPSPTQEDKSD